jgi:hypothetical protein
MEKFNPSEEMVESARTVFAAMAMVETIKPIVQGYQRTVLEKHQFHIAKVWIKKGMQDRIILKAEDTYLMADADFLVYLSECDREASGLKIDKSGFCPLLVAESLQSDAEYELIRSMENITHLSPSALYGENRKKFLDLTLRLLAPFVKTGGEK